MSSVRTAGIALAGLTISIVAGQAAAAPNIPCLDAKREFVGVIMSRMRWIPEGGGGRDEAFRGELYRQFWAEEAN